MLNGSEAYKSIKFIHPACKFNYFIFTFHGKNPGPVLPLPLLSVGVGPSCLGERAFTFKRAELDVGLIQAGGSCRERYQHL